MQLAPCRPCFSSSSPLPPLPPLPLRFADTPTPQDLLLECMAAGFPPDPRLPPPRVARICRDALPAMLGNFFPHPDTPLVNAIAAYRALLFALRMSSEALPDDPALQPFLQGFCRSLEQAGIFAAWIAAAHDQAEDEAFCDSWILPKLQAGEPVLLEGGYDAPQGGHAAGVYLWPLAGQTTGAGAAADETLLVVADRLAGEVHHLEDRPRHPQPLVYRFKTSVLVGEAGKAFFRALMALQHPAEGHALQQFYAAIERLAADGCGVLELGPEAHGSARRDLAVAGQAALKSDTCTVSSALTVLHFALHAAFGTLDPCADPARREAVRAVYKQLKDRCRSAVLEQFVGALKQVRCGADPAPMAAYEAALARTRDYLTARAAQPHLAGHLAALRTV